jgi:hypothetical protein
VIWHLGGERFAAGAWEGELTEKESNVLQAFIGCPSRSTGTLKSRSGEDNPARVLRDLRAKYDGCFAPAVHLPGQKGKGGYRVRVERAPAE